MLPPGWALGVRVRWFVGLLFLIGSGAWAAVPGVGRLVGCTRVRYLCLFVLLLVSSCFSRWLVVRVLRLRAPSCHGEFGGHQLG